MSNSKCCLSVGTDYDDEDHAGDGSDNMLEGDKREKKGAAIWRHCSRPEVERGIGPNEWTIRHHQHFSSKTEAMIDTHA